MYGSRLRGLMLFGSRIAGDARADSDLDVGVWLEPPVRRQTSWVPWAEAFEDADPPLDPTFFTSAAFDNPPGWLLEANRRGVRIIYDTDGALARNLAALNDAVTAGTYRRRLFMGLPYYERSSV
jgi:predicted nucleotidyltransferase